MALPNDPDLQDERDGIVVSGMEANGADESEVDDDGPHHPCYRAGTRIATERGEVAVEALELGDRVVTATGRLRAVRWLGHRRVATEKQPHPASVWPYLIEAGAFADGVPSRNLWLSPRHSVAVEGALVPICALANGRTIRQERLPMVEYWHVELDSHDVILAEGLAAESYLDNGNRSAFVNGDAFIQAHPDVSPKHWLETCLPLVEAGPIVRRAKAALLARAAALGEAITADDDLHVMADGRRIDPVPLGNGRRAFLLPEASAITLRSRAFVPAEMIAESTDDRVLGFCISRLQLDGSDVALDDEAMFADGWHLMEVTPDGGRQRWSMGVVPLPAGTRLVTVDLAGPGLYWRVRQNNVVAMFLPA